MSFKSSLFAVTLVLALAFNNQVCHSEVLRSEGVLSLISAEMNQAGVVDSTGQVLGINSRRRSSQYGTVNKTKLLWFGAANVALATGAYFWSQEAWGASSGRFHWKHDWWDDNLAQNDEVSHTVISYNGCHALQPVYRWMGFSPDRSMTYATIHSALWATLVEYPLDAYNSLQGFGVSDLAANYLGCGLALGQYHVSPLRNFGLKLSFKRAPWSANPHGLAGTAPEFDNEIYWLLFQPRNGLIDFLQYGVGYSTNHDNIKVEREYYLGFGTTLPDFAGIFSPKLAEWTVPLKMFLLELHFRL